MSDVPRVRVAAVIPLQGRIVLVAHSKGGRTYHLLPGGGVERGETVERALTREIREETGLSCRIVRPLFVSDTIAPDGSRHVVNLTFLAEAISGEPRAPAEDGRLIGVVLADVEDLHAYDLRPPMSAQLMEAARSGWSCEARYLGLLWKEEGPGV